MKEGKKDKKIKSCSMFIKIQFKNRIFFFTLQLIRIRNT